MPSPGVSRRRVALVCMPFQVTPLPSLALGTLSEALRNRGHEVDVVYLNLDVARRSSARAYQRVATHQGWACQLGEWLFSHPSITPGAATWPEYRRFLLAQPAYLGSKQLTQIDLPGFKNDVDALLDEWIETHDWGSYDIVGFTVFVQQLNASLRLAHAIKQRHPRGRIVFGGSAFEQPMGKAVLERYPWLDDLFSGHADRTFPAYVDQMPVTSSEPIVDRGAPFELDELPIPNFDSYFDKLRCVGLEPFVDPWVPIETSRGCWWGEANQCVFCGFNAHELRYRQKSAGRIVDEVRELSRYQCSLWAADNILPRNFLEEISPRLVQEGLGFGGDGFFEIKSNIDGGQLRALRRLGVTRVQPGIESLSSSVLESMHKGVKASQNISMLRTAAELGMAVAWNILYGLPNESPAAYGEMARYLPLLSHLPAPARTSRIRLDRFSPLYNDAESYGLRDIQPARAYERVFGPHPSLGEQSFFFDFNFADDRDPEHYAEPVIVALQRWIDLHRGRLAPVCEAFVLGGQRLLIDSRRLDRMGRSLPRIRRLGGAEWRLLEMLDRPQRPEALEQQWDDGSPLQPLLGRLEEQHLVMRLDGRLFRLVVIRDRGFWRDRLDYSLTGALRRRLAKLRQTVHNASVDLLRPLRTR